MVIHNFTVLFKAVLDFLTYICEKTIPLLLAWFFYIFPEKKLERKVAI